MNISIHLTTCVGGEGCVCVSKYSFELSRLVHLQFWMAGNPQRFQMPGEGEPDPSRSRFGSFPMQPPGPEEFGRLQELLAQALKREAEAHRKVKHLHEQLIEMQARSPRTRSTSDGK